MRKVTFLTCILTLLMLTSLQKASAEYTVLNGSKYKVSLLVSTWMEARGDIPAGYHTKGYYKIDPGDFFPINWGSSDYYIRMHKWVNGNRKLIRPSGYETRDHYDFWVDPKNAFTIVETADEKILYPYSAESRENLEEFPGFYKYQNGGTFTISGDNLELSEKKFKLSEINRELTAKRITLLLNDQPDEIRHQEVHALLILLGNDGEIRPAVKHNESHMKKLLRQVSQYADVHLTVMTSEDEVTGKVTTMKISAGYTTDIKRFPQGLIRGHQVDDWLNNLDVGQHDTILIYYNGHGMMQDSNKHILSFDHYTGDKVIRSKLREELEQKSGRLKMLITDTCSNRVRTPEFVAKGVNFASIRQRSTDYIKHLFLQHEGILDITAVKPGHYAWGSTDIGGYFTVGILQSFTTESDTNRDRFLTWKEVFEKAESKTDQLFKQTVFQEEDELMMWEVGQKTQQPAGHSFPTRAD